MYRQPLGKYVAITTAHLLLVNISFSNSFSPLWLTVNSVTSEAVMQTATSFSQLSEGLDVQLLCDALRHFPSQTPKRWELVAQLVSTATAKFASTGPDLHLHGGAVRFTPVQHCRSLSLLLHDHYPALLKYNDTFVTEALFEQPQKDAFKPIVLIPIVETFCGLPVVVRNIISTRLHYTGNAYCCLLSFAMQIRKVWQKVLPQSL